jgi:hypothetical protein
VITAADRMNLARFYLPILALFLTFQAPRARGAVTFSGFEGVGLDGWTPRAIDIDNPPVTWSITRSTERPFEGQGSAKFDVANFNDAAKVWLERAFDVTPGARYDVTVSYQFATPDFAVGSWQIITFAQDDAPKTRDDLNFIGDTYKGDDGQGYRWLSKSYKAEVFTADGTLHVGVGVWGTFESANLYYVDNLRVEITEVPDAAAAPLAIVALGCLSLRRLARRSPSRQFLMP